MRRALNRAREVCNDLLLWPLTTMPGRTGNSLRRAYYKRRLASMGSGVTIDVGAQLINPEYISLGDRCWIDKYTVLLAGPAREGERRLTYRDPQSSDARRGYLDVGENCHIASHCVLNGHGGLSIGNNSTLAAGSVVLSLSHHHRNLNDPEDKFLYRFGSQVPDDEQALISGQVRIEDNAAVGTNSVVLPGSRIGQNSWVGACSLVRGEIPENVIAAGSPAKPIGPRYGAEG